MTQTHLLVYHENAATMKNLAFYSNSVTASRPIATSLKKTSNLKFPPTCHSAFNVTVSADAYLKCSMLFPSSSALSIFMKHFLCAFIIIHCFCFICFTIKSEVQPYRPFTKSKMQPSQSGSQAKLIAHPFPELFCLNLFCTV